MEQSFAHTIVNQQNGNLGFKIIRFNTNDHCDHLQQNNYFPLVWITGGTRKAKVYFLE